MELDSSFNASTASDLPLSKAEYIGVGVFLLISGKSNTANCEVLSVKRQRITGFDHPPKQIALDVKGEIAVKITRMDHCNSVMDLTLSGMSMLQPMCKSTQLKFAPFRHCSTKII